jgi:hypothetical protein
VCLGALHLQVTHGPLLVQLQLQDVVLLVLLGLQ